MILYSCLLAIGLVLSAPWWLWRMATSGRYRKGLAGRLGAVPNALRQAVAGNETIWLHAVSVGEIVAAEKLVNDLQASLPGWVIAVSTTTATGYELARQRLPRSPVFFLPLDFAFTLRRYLDVIRPSLVVLMESELWPRMLVECERAHVPVVVVNARISDRSLPRYLRLKFFWQPLLAKVAFFLAQGQEAADRLTRIGVAADRVRVVGNLKYDAPVSPFNPLVTALRSRLPEADFIVCGSTLPGEEVDIIEAWVRLVSTGHRGVLLIAPRSPQRFDAVVSLAGRNAIRVSEWEKNPRNLNLGEIMVLDSIGSLAAIYQVATVAFLGGSLVTAGGHNPLEAARFGVPVVMGPSYENFREIVDTMRSQDAIIIVENRDLTLALHQAMGQAPSRGTKIGENGRRFYTSQTGATERARIALIGLLGVNPASTPR